MNATVSHEEPDGGETSQLPAQEQLSSSADAMEASDDFGPLPGIAWTTAHPNDGARLSSSTPRHRAGLHRPTIFVLAVAVAVAFAAVLMIRLLDGTSHRVTAQAGHSKASPGSSQPTSIGKNALNRTVVGTASPVLSQIPGRGASSPPRTAPATAPAPTAATPSPTGQSGIPASSTAVLSPSVTASPTAKRSRHSKPPRPSPSPT